MHKFSFGALFFGALLCGGGLTASPELKVSANLDDLTELNHNEKVLVPGIGINERVVSYEWETIDPAVTNQGNALQFLLSTAKNVPREDVRGVRIEAGRFQDTLKLFPRDDDDAAGEWDEFSIHIESAFLSLTPFKTEEGDWRFILGADLDSAEVAGKAETRLREVLNEIRFPADDQVLREDRRVEVILDFPSAKLSEMLQAVMKWQFERVFKERAVERETGPGLPEINPLPRERIEAVIKAERDFLVRELYQPLVERLDKETPEHREAWKGILQTGRDMLYYEGGGVLKAWREYLGRGAEEAYKAGCRYPLPIAYSYASLIKRKPDIQQAFQDCYDAMKDDRGWTRATRLCFIAFLCVGDNAPAGLVDKVALEHQAAKDFLVGTKFAPDELGMAYHLVQFAVHGNYSDVLYDVGKAGVKLDPWLEAMLEADCAYERAWAARGSGYANTVTEDGWAVYHEEIEKVLPLCEKAYRLRPELPQSGWLALRTCQGDRDEMQKWIARVLACRPGYLQALAPYFFGSRPRWGGSVRLMARRMTELIERGDYDTTTPIFAYERLLTDVFIGEGGVVTAHEQSPDFNAYLLERKNVFAPMFDGYRKSGLADTASTVERAHITLALSDLAWRLDDYEELKFWWNKFKAIGMPAREIYFDFVSKYFDEDLANPLTRSLKKAGVIDARSLFRPDRSLVLDLDGRTLDHLVIRYRIAGGKDANRTNFRNQFWVSGYNGREPGEEKYLEFDTCRGRWPQKDRINWAREDEEMTCELEIVGKKARLTQKGRRIWEKTFCATPSTARTYELRCTIGPGVEVKEFTIEVSTARDFIVESDENPVPEPRGIKPVLTLDKGEVTPRIELKEPLKEGTGAVYYDDFPYDLPEEKAVCSFNGGKMYAGVSYDAKGCLKFSAGAANGKSWPSRNAVDALNRGVMTFSYSYENGVISYNKGPNWTIQVLNVPKCRYQGETIHTIDLPLFDALKVSRVIVYPAVLGLHDLTDL